MRIFGFDIIRPQEAELESFASPINDDGAMNVGTALGGSYGTFMDMNSTASSEGNLVTKYRQLAQQPEVATAIDEVVNDAINVGMDEEIVTVITDDINVGQNVKKRITEEFDNIMTLLDFSNKGYDIFSKWYVDGRINYHVMIDEKNLKAGIQELRYLDPRKLRLIREMDDQKIDESGIPLKSIKNEFYMYAEAGFAGATSSGQSDGTVSGYRVAKDSIVRSTSGLVSEDNSMVLSHLHKSMRNINQLRMLEDATVIYTITRAPERRIFYIDVGNLPKMKAEQYLHDMMNKHKNKLVYNSANGDIGDQRNMMTMTEDFWFPRREGSRGTEIDTLTGASELLSEGFLDYFLKRVYKSLNVPISRLEPENSYAFGRVSEISREEVRFSKFIRRLRARFAILFDEILEKQLILKGIITPEDWPAIRDSLRYDFNQDNYFEELKEMEILRERVTLLTEMEEITGVYVSKEWAKTEILKQSKEVQAKMKVQMEKEKAEEPEEEFDV